MPDRRTEILSAALRIIAAGGPDAVTHRRVAAEAGVPLGSTTYYFSSREDLIRESLRHYLARATEALGALETAWTRNDLSPATLAGFLADIVAQEFASGSASVLIEYELIVYAARHADFAPEVRAWQRALTSALGERLEVLDVDRPFETARTLVAVVRGFEVEQLTGSAVETPALRRRLESVICAASASRTGAGKHG